MKHFTDGSFGYSEEPFPAFRSELVFGRNKRDFEFLPSKVVPDDEGILPNNQFRIIKTKAKGTLLIVPGTDDTPRALVFAGIRGGFRGWCGIVERDTTATVLKECSAANNCHSRTEVVALFAVGDTLVFHSSGRRNDDIVVVAFDGRDLTRTEYEKAEYLAIEDSEQEAEIL